MQGCRGEHYAVAIASSKKSQELEFTASITVTEICILLNCDRRRKVKLTSRKVCLEIERLRDYVCIESFNWSTEGKVRVFADVEKCSEP